MKTSTGYGTSGATPEDVALMRKHSPARVQVKAAAGVRDLASLVKFRELGASRVGTSKTALLLDEARKSLGLPAIRIDGLKAGAY